MKLGTPTPIPILAPVLREEPEPLAAEEFARDPPVYEDDGVASDPWEVIRVVAAGVRGM